MIGDLTGEVVHVTEPGKVIESPLGWPYKRPRFAFLQDGCIDSEFIAG